MSTIVLEHRERDRRNGLIGTIIFHVLLTLLFLFIGLQQPNPLPEEIGIELAFEDMGGLSGGVVAPVPGSPQQSTPTPVAPTEPDEVATEEDSPVAVPKPVQPKPKPQPKPETPQPPKPNRDALFTPSTNPNPGTDPGGSTTPGTTPGGGGTGDFKGRGFEGKLEGRGLGKGPTITDKPPVDRRTVIALFIFVDRDGRVTRTANNLDKSTSTRMDLFNIASKAAMTMRFTARPDAAQEQRGELLFIFEPE